MVGPIADDLGRLPMFYGCWSDVLTGCSTVINVVLLGLDVIAVWIGIVYWPGLDIVSMRRVGGVVLCRCVRVGRGGGFV